MPVEVKCQACGVVKSFPPSIAKNRKYCSMRCFPRKGTDNPNWKGGLLKRTCEVCKKEFEVKIKVTRSGGGIYCGNVCKNKGAGRKRAAHSIAKRQKLWCGTCKTSIRIKDSAVAKGQGKYCSTACMAKAYKTTLRGELNPNYRHGKANLTSHYNNIRRSAEGQYSQEDIDFLFTSQKKKCVNCLISIKDGFHIDHIYPVSKGGTNWPTNLQLLCAYCNHSKHAKDPIEWAQTQGRLL